LAETDVHAERRSTEPNSYTVDLLGFHRKLKKARSEQLTPENLENTLTKQMKTAENVRERGQNSYPKKALRKLQENPRKLQTT